MGSMLIRVKMGSSNNEVKKKFSQNDNDNDNDFSQKLVQLF